MNIESLYNFENDIQEALAIVKQGGTILYPTDTVWGIGCDATDPIAVERIYTLKGRSEEKSMILLVDTFKMLKTFVPNITDEWLAILGGFKTPTTVVYPYAVGIASNAMAMDGSIAIRVCNASFCKDLIAAFGKPIVSTSANKSGEKTPANFSEVDVKIRAAVGYIVRHRQMEDATFKPSSIIKWKNNNLFEIIRNGK